MKSLCREIYAGNPNWQVVSCARLIILCTVKLNSNKYQSFGRRSDGANFSGRSNKSPNNRNLRRVRRQLKAEKSVHRGAGAAAWQRGPVLVHAQPKSCRANHCPQRTLRR